MFESGRQSAADRYGYTRHDFFNFFDSLDCDLFDLFGLPMTIVLWDRYDVPWYAIAAARGTEQIVFVRDVLPHIISQLETKPPYALTATCAALVLARLAVSVAACGSRQLNHGRQPQGSIVAVL